MRLTLYTKPGCHLCEELAAVLGALRADYGFVLEEIDITSDRALTALYGRDIPVLLRDGEEIARGSVSARDLESLLNARTG